MYEAYRIGVTLTLNNLVTPQLLKLSEDLTKLDIKVLALSKSLKAAGMESAGLKSVASASQATARALELASSRAAILEKRLGALRTAGNVPSLIPTPGGGNGGGARGGGRSHGGAEGGRMHMGANGVGLGAISYGLGAEAMLPLAIASGGVYAAKGGYEAAKDFQTEVARLTVMGLDRAQVEASVAYVEGLKTWGTSKT
uniref:hypothetical protein n=1 Tax=Niveibacterium sp. TaxID=2017444 RepID=UPI0035B2EEA0